MVTLKLWLEPTSKHFYCEWNGNIDFISVYGIAVNLHLSLTTSVITFDFFNLFISFLFIIFVVLSSKRTGALTGKQAQAIPIPHGEPPTAARSIRGKASYVLQRSDVFLKK